MLYKKAYIHDSSCDVRLCTVRLLVTHIYTDTNICLKLEINLSN